MTGRAALAGAAPLSHPALTAYACAFALLAALVAPATLAYQLGVYGVLLAKGGASAFVLAALAAGLRTDQDTPLAASLAVARAHGPRALGGLVGLALVLAAYTTLKTMIPALVPFYADPALAAADRAVLGRDGWTLLAAVVPSWGKDGLRWLYGGPWFASWIGTALFAVAMPPSALRTTYLWAFALKLSLLGVAVAGLASSAGPVFHDRLLGGDDFAGLTRMLSEDGGHGLLAPSYLWDSYVAGRLGIGTGISAFPSVHCAGAVLTALFWWRVSRAAGAVAWAFAGAIYLGSVLTGWHYASDGLASLVGVLAIWHGTSAVLARQGTEDRPAARSSISASSVSVGT